MARVVDDQGAAAGVSGGRPGKKTLKQFLRAGLSADRLVIGVQGPSRNVWPANEAIVIKAGEKPVVRFPSDIDTARAGALDGGDEMRIQGFGHRLASSGWAMGNDRNDSR